MIWRMMTMSDQAIIDALVRTLKASGEPYQMGWHPLMVQVRDQLGLTTEEVNVAIMESIDAGVLLEARIGIVRVQAQPLIENDAGVPAPAEK
jgi:hypothetical protein